MQWKLSSLVTLLSAVSAAWALTLDTPIGPHNTGEPLLVGFQSTPEDPSFNLILSNSALAKSFQVATNVSPRGDVTGFNVPCVGPDLEGWIVVAVNSTQTNMVLAVTQPLELTQGPTC